MLGCYGIFDFFRKLPIENLRIAVVINTRYDEEGSSLETWV